MAYRQRHLLNITIIPAQITNRLQFYQFVGGERLQRPVRAAEGRAEKKRLPHGAAVDADI